MSINTIVDSLPVNIGNYLHHSSKSHPRITTIALVTISGLIVGLGIGLTLSAARAVFFLLPPTPAPICYIPSTLLSLPRIRLISCVAAGIGLMVGIAKTPRLLEELSYRALSSEYQVCVRKAIASGNRQELEKYLTEVSKNLPPDRISRFLNYITDEDPKTLLELAKQSSNSRELMDFLVTFEKSIKTILFDVSIESLIFFRRATPKEMHANIHPVVYRIYLLPIPFVVAAVILIMVSVVFYYTRASFNNNPQNIYLINTSPSLPTLVCQTAIVGLALIAGITAGVSLNKNTAHVFEAAKNDIGIGHLVDLHEDLHRILHGFLTQHYYTPAGADRANDTNSPAIVKGDLPAQVAVRAKRVDLLKTVLELANGSLTGKKMIAYLNHANEEGETIRSIARSKKLEPELEAILNDLELSDLILAGDP